MARKRLSHRNREISLSVVLAFSVTTHGTARILDMLAPAPILAFVVSLALSAITHGIPCDQLNLLTMSRFYVQYIVEEEGLPQLDSPGFEVKLIQRLHGYMKARSNGLLRLASAALRSTFASDRGPLWNISVWLQYLPHPSYLMATPQNVCSFIPPFDSLPQDNFPVLFQDVRRFR